MIKQSSSSKNLKNYMYDNQNMKESKCKKPSNCCESIEGETSDTEVWILQCPKSFDPKKMVGHELGKKPQQCDEPKLECTAERFCEKKILTVISPEKLAEYSLVCDKMKLVKPVGKIIVSETNKNVDDEEFSSNPCCAVPLNQSQITQSDCESDEQLEDDECSSDVEVKPIANKKVKKKLNDQRFTIETTVTVEQCCADKKKGKKNKNLGESSDCLPLCPPEPCPLKKKTKKSKNESELGWM